MATTSEHSKAGWLTRNMAGMFGPGRYRWRTRLRGWLPYALAMRVTKGRGDCGNHDWYRSEGELFRCYHCEVGEHRGWPWPDEKPQISIQGGLEGSSARAAPR